MTRIPFRRHTVWPAHYIPNTIHIICNLWSSVVVIYRPILPHIQLFYPHPVILSISSYSINIRVMCALMPVQRPRNTDNCATSTHFGPSVAIWYQKSWPTLVQGTAWCLQAPEHHTNQYIFIVNWVFRNIQFLSWKFIRKCRLHEHHCAQA